MTKENTWFFVIALAFAIGVFFGGMYCAFVKNGAELYEYLNGIVATVKEGTDKTVIFRQAVMSDIKFVVLLFVCAFVRFGVVPICAVAALRGFSVGFTFASLFKFFGNNGILLVLSQMPSEVIGFCVIVIFGAVCARTSVVKRDKGIYAVLIVVFAGAVMCSVLSAVCKGYLDVWLMEKITHRLY